MSITALQTRISRPRRNDTILLTPLETDTFIRASAPPSSITCAITQSSSWCEDSDEKPFLQRRTTLQLILEDFFSGDPAQHQRELARIEQQARDLHDRLARLNVDLRFGHAEDQCGGSKAFEQMVAEIEREQEAARKSKVGRVTERLARFFENVSKMKDVVDTMVSSNPQYSALVWGGVKFLMMVSFGILPHRPSFDWMNLMALVVLV
ncbi:hypothetical protein EX30DRAFT_249358 [Ascodesmis nigricans]|uniref:DUF7708 domain-containing protein n=1 Tax=Ascodesmis nigricans TaxID=341454 RepID=A0A4S2MY97_9PEZI|nr:hypothetical protein EX30DRAFT_249358 [Ascodesmis nigricans]